VDWVDAVASVADVRVFPIACVDLNKGCGCVVSTDAERRCENRPIIFELIGHLADDATRPALVVGVEGLAPLDATVELDKGHIFHPRSLESG
jgi:hypothetical protein